MKRLSIEHLNIRLKGVSPTAARAALKGLGPALLKQLVAQDSLGGRGKVRLGNLEAANVTLERHFSKDALQRSVAQAVVAAVTAESKGQG